MKTPDLLLDLNSLLFIPEVVVSIVKASAVLCNNINLLENVKDRLYWLSVNWKFAFGALASQGHDESLVTL
jgi:hypothetical protein